METELHVNSVIQEWETVNVGGRVSGRVTVCQNTISYWSQRLSLKNVISPLLCYVIISAWNVYAVSGSYVESDQLLVDDLTLTIILLLWQLNHQFLIMVKIRSDMIKPLKGLSMPGLGFNDQISVSLVG